MMNKEQAIQQIANHLELLTDYDVLEANLAETLFSYITEIVEQIQVEITGEDIAKNVIALWGNLKDSTKEHGYGDEFNK
jgi:hypothetical protein